MDPMITSIILISLALIGIVTIVIPRTLHMKTEWALVAIGIGIMVIGVLTNG